MTIDTARRMIGRAIIGTGHEHYRAIQAAELAARNLRPDPAAWSRACHAAIEHRLACRRLAAAALQLAIR